MVSAPRSSDPEHPLFADRDRLDKVADVMYAAIHKTLHWANPGLQPRGAANRLSGAGDADRTLGGTGIGADDILAEALLALAEYPPEQIRGSWEGLAVRVAQNKAKDALEAAEKGLRATDHRPQLYLVSGERTGLGPDGESEPALFDLQPDEWVNLEAEYFALAHVLEVRDLAREILEEREREIFFAIHFYGYSRREVGEALGLTSQRIGQIYSSALDRLEAHPQYPFKPNTHPE